MAEHPHRRPGPSRQEVDAAAVTDRFADLLLAADERRAPDVPADVDVDPAVRLAARRLRADLVRVHPSFAFEERLAARLERAAERVRADLPAEEPGPAFRVGGVTIPFPSGRSSEGRRRRQSGPTPAAETGLADGGLSHLADASFDGVLLGFPAARLDGPLDGALDPSLADALEDAAGSPLSGSLAGSLADPLGGRASRAATIGSFPAAALARLQARPAPFLVGGVASAALSIGAVYVAWRWSRPQSGVPIARGRVDHARRGPAVLQGLLGMVS